MRKSYFSCDIGSCAVLCGENIINFSNGCGDGTFKVYEFESEEEFAEYKKEHLEKYNINYNDYHFITSCIFNNAKVLSYDCLELDKITKDNVLFELTGRYAIYNNYGKIYFVKWEK